MTTLLAVTMQDDAYAEEKNSKQVPGLAACKQAIKCF